MGDQKWQQGSGMSQFFTNTSPHFHFFAAVAVNEDVDGRQYAKNLSSAQGRPSKVSYQDFEAGPVNLTTRQDEVEGTTETPDTFSADSTLTRSSVEL